MAEERKNPIAPAAEDNAPSALDVGDSLASKEAEKDINRAGADANENEEQGETREEMAKRLAKERKASFEYADNYRQKLKKDAEERPTTPAQRRKKAEKEAAIAREKEERERERLEAIEKEKEEARARAERADALLDQVEKSLAEKKAQEEATEEPVNEAPTVEAPAEPETEAPAEPEAESPAEEPEAPVAEDDAAEEESVPEQPEEAVSESEEQPEEEDVPDEEPIDEDEDDNMIFSFDPDEDGSADDLFSSDDEGEPEEDDSGMLLTYHVGDEHFIYDEVPEDEAPAEPAHDQPAEEPASAPVRKPAAPAANKPKAKKKRKPKKAVKAPKKAGVALKKPVAKKPVNVVADVDTPIDDEIARLLEENKQLLKENIDELRRKQAELEKRQDALESAAPALAEGEETPESPVETAVADVSDDLLAASPETADEVAVKKDDLSTEAPEDIKTEDAEHVADQPAESTEKSIFIDPDQTKVLNRGVGDRVLTEIPDSELIINFGEGRDLGGDASVSNVNNYNATYVTTGDFDDRDKLYSPGTAAAGALAALGLGAMSASALKKKIRDNDAIKNRLEKKLADANKAYRLAKSKEDKQEALAECAEIQRSILDFDAESLAATKALNKNTDKRKRALQKDVVKYNGYAEKLEEQSLTKIERAPSSLASDILAGRDYTRLPQIVQRDLDDNNEEQKAPLSHISQVDNDDDPGFGSGKSRSKKRKLSKKELRRSARDLKEKARDNKRHLKENRSDVKRKLLDAQNSEYAQKTENLASALNYQREVIAILGDSYETAVRTDNKGEARRLSREIDREVKAYNRIAKQVEDRTGEPIPMAFNTFAKDLSDRQERQLPKVVKYGNSASEGTFTDSEDILVIPYRVVEEHKPTDLPVDAPADVQAPIYFTPQITPDGQHILVMADPSAFIAATQQPTAEIVTTEEAPAETEPRPLTERITEDSEAAIVIPGRSSDTDDATGIAAAAAAVTVGPLSRRIVESVTETKKATADKKDVVLAPADEQVIEEVLPISNRVVEYDDRAKVIPGSTDDSITVEPAGQPIQSIKEVETSFAPKSERVDAHSTDSATLHMPTREVTEDDEAHYGDEIVTIVGEEAPMAAEVEDKAAPAESESARSVREHIIIGKSGIKSVSDKAEEAHEAAVVAVPDIDEKYEEAVFGELDTSDSGDGVVAIVGEDSYVISDEFEDSAAAEIPLADRIIEHADSAMKIPGKPEKEKSEKSLAGAAAAAAIAGAVISDAVSDSDKKDDVSVTPEDEQTYSEEAHDAPLYELIADEEVLAEQPEEKTIEKADDSVVDAIVGSVDDAEEADGEVKLADIEADDKAESEEARASTPLVNRIVEHKDSERRIAGKPETEETAEETADSKEEASYVYIPLVDRVVEQKDSARRIAGKPETKETAEEPIAEAAVIAKKHIVEEAAPQKKAEEKIEKTVDADTVKDQVVTKSEEIKPARPVTKRIAEDVLAAKVIEGSKDALEAETKEASKKAVPSPIYDVVEDTDNIKVIPSNPALNVAPRYDKVPLEEREVQVIVPKHIAEIPDSAKTVKAEIPGINTDESFDFVIPFVLAGDESKKSAEESKAEEKPSDTNNNVEKETEKLADEQVKDEIPTEEKTKEELSEGKVPKFILSKFMPPKADEPELASMSKIGYDGKKISLADAEKLNYVGINARPLYHGKPLAQGSRGELCSTPKNASANVNGYFYFDGVEIDEEHALTFWREDGAVCRGKFAVQRGENDSFRVAYSDENTGESYFITAAPTSNVLSVDVDVTNGFVIDKVKGYKTKEEAFADEIAAAPAVVYVPVPAQPAEEAKAPEQVIEPGVVSVKGSLGDSTVDTIDYDLAEDSDLDKAPAAHKEEAQSQSVTEDTVPEEKPDVVIGDTAEAPAETVTSTYVLKEYPPMRKAEKAAESEATVAEAVVQRPDPVVIYGKEKAKNAVAVEEKSEDIVIARNKENSYAIFEQSSVRPPEVIVKGAAKRDVVEEKATLKSSAEPEMVLNYSEAKVISGSASDGVREVIVDSASAKVIAGKILETPKAKGAYVIKETAREDVKDEALATEFTGYIITENSKDKKIISAKDKTEAVTETIEEAPASRDIVVNFADAKVIEAKVIKTPKAKGAYQITETAQPSGKDALVEEDIVYTGEEIVTVLDDEKPENYTVLSSDDAPEYIADKSKSESILDDTLYTTAAATESDAISSHRVVVDSAKVIGAKVLNTPKAKGAYIIAEEARTAEAAPASSDEIVYTGEEIITVLEDKHEAAVADTKTSEYAVMTSDDVYEERKHSGEIPEQSITLSAITEDTENAKFADSAEVYESEKAVSGKILEAPKAKGAYVLTESESYEKASASAGESVVTEAPEKSVSITDMPVDFDGSIPEIIEVSDEAVIETVCDKTLADSTPIEGKVLNAPKAKGAYVIAEQDSAKTIGAKASRTDDVPAPALSENAVEEEYKTSTGETVTIVRDGAPVKEEAKQPIAEKELKLEDVATEAVKSRVVSEQSGSERVIESVKIINAPKSRDAYVIIEETHAPKAAENIVISGKESAAKATVVADHKDAKIVEAKAKAASDSAAYTISESENEKAALLRNKILKANSKNSYVLLESVDAKVLSSSSDTVAKAAGISADDSAKRTVERKPVSGLSVDETSAKVIGAASEEYGITVHPEDSKIISAETKGTYKVSETKNPKELLIHNKVLNASKSNNKYVLLESRETKVLGSAGTEDKALFSVTESMTPASLPQSFVASELARDVQEDTLQQESTPLIKKGTKVLNSTKSNDRYYITESYDTEVQENAPEAATDIHIISDSIPGRKLEIVSRDPAEKFHVLNNDNGKLEIISRDPAEQVYVINNGKASGKLEIVSRSTPEQVNIVTEAKAARKDRLEIVSREPAEKFHIMKDGNGKLEIVSRDPGKEVYISGAGKSGNKLEILSRNTRQEINISKDSKAGGKLEIVSTENINIATHDETKSGKLDVVERVRNFITLTPEKSKSIEIKERGPEEIFLHRRKEKANIEIVERTVNSDPEYRTNVLRIEENPVILLKRPRVEIINRGLEDRPTEVKTTKKLENKRKSSSAVSANVEDCIVEYKGTEKLVQNKVAKVDVFINPYKDINMGIITVNDLNKYLKNANKQILDWKKEYKAAEKQKESLESRGDKVMAHIAMVNYQCLICETYVEKIVICIKADLSAASRKEAYEAAKNNAEALKKELKLYNDLITEYNAMTSSKIPLADKTIVKRVLDGESYEHLRRINYTVVNEKQPLKTKKSKKLKGKIIQDERYIADIKLINRCDEETKNDLSMIENRYKFEMTLLSNEKEIIPYKFDKNSIANTRRKAFITRKLKSLKKMQQNALKAETIDNERYYRVLTCDPNLESYKNNEKKTTQVSALTLKLSDLLKKRDELNHKLNALYSGALGDVEGVIDNDKWHDIKLLALKRHSRKLRRKANSLKRSIPTSIFDSPDSKAKQMHVFNSLLDSKVEALATIDLCNYRLRKEKNSLTEKNKINKDKKEARKLIKNIDKQIKNKKKVILDKYYGPGASFEAIALLAMVALLGVGAYLVLDKVGIDVMGIVMKLVDALKERIPMLKDLLQGGINL